MGTLITTSTMIKLILGSALLALTAAEADPQLIYGAGLAPFGLAPVGAVAHAPVVKAVVEKPAEVEHEVTAHTVPLAVGYHGYPHFGYYGYGGYGGYRGYYGGRYGYPHGYYGERSADAEPAVLDGASRVISAPTPLIHNPPVLPVAYAAHPLAYHAGLPGHLAYAGLPYAGYPLVAAPAPVAAADEAVVAERKKRE